MEITKPLNLKRWVESNRHLLKPPVGNKVVYEDGDFIIMVVGGPNERKDYHVDPLEEFFFQLEGDMMLKIIDNGKKVDMIIKEGEIFLLPKNIPHSPQRYSNTVGLVVEYKRISGVFDTFQWYCDSCHNLLYEVKVELEDIVFQLPVVFESYWENISARTCESCGEIQEPTDK
jgi:3-hydroxyanthranilate 3,4-dioxygenase